MKATVIIDNIASEGLTGEWGLSIYIEHMGRKILLDSGSGPNFGDNAKSLGIDLKQIDIAVLSHAHYDHGDGFDRFFEENRKAKLYLQKCSCENCYRHDPSATRYIGLRKGMLADYGTRLVPVDGDMELFPGAYLLAHHTEGLGAIGEKAFMFVEGSEGVLVPDDFSHEQSLVLDTEKGLVIFNSCSHGGADNIIKEVAAAFPGKHIYALVGGFHLFESSDDDVNALADRIKVTGIDLIATGHCTGEHAYELLKARLGDAATQIFCGYTIEA